MKVPFGVFLSITFICVLLSCDNDVAGPQVPEPSKNNTFYIVQDVQVVEFFSEGWYYGSINTFRNDFYAMAPVSIKVRIKNVSSNMGIYGIQYGGISSNFKLSIRADGSYATRGYFYEAFEGNHSPVIKTSAGEENDLEIKITRSGTWAYIDYYINGTQIWNTSLYNNQMLWDDFLEFYGASLIHYIVQYDPSSPPAETDPYQVQFRTVSPMKWPQ